MTVFSVFKIETNRANTIKLNLFENFDKADCQHDGTPELGSTGYEFSATESSLFCHDSEFHFQSTSFESLLIHFSQGL